MPIDTNRIADLQLELWNTGSAEIAKQLYDEQAERSDPNGRERMQHHGVRAIAEFVAQVRAAFPDFTLNLRESVADGDMVALGWTITGTQDGEFQGLPASGQRVEIDGMTFCRLRDGKVVTEDVYFDRLALLEQLGVSAAGMAASGAR